MTGSPALGGATALALSSAWVTEVDWCHVPRYTSGVIKTFADKRTKELYQTGKSKRFPPDMWERALRTLDYLDLAMSVVRLESSSKQSAAQIGARPGRALLDFR